MRSVRARLTVLFVLLTAGFLATFAASQYLWMRARWDEQLDKDVEIEWREFEAHFRDEYDEFKRGVNKELEPKLDEFAKLSETLIEVRRADGTLLYASAGFQPVLDGPRVRARVGDVDYRGVAGRVRSLDGDEFTVALAVSEEAYHRHLAEVRRYFAVFFPVVLAIAALFGYLFVGRSLVPVEEIRQQAERISRERLTERIPEGRLTGEFQRLAQTFNGMLERLDVAFQDLQHFAADASHELRTPLANLRAQIETAIQQRLTPEEHEQILEGIARDVARMNRIVTDLFTLAQLEMRQQVLQSEPVRLAPLLDEASEVWRPSAAARGIKIDYQGDDAEVIGNSAALHRVFSNLVENAVKYNRDGGRVTLRLGRTNGKAWVCVEDTGIGIAEEHLARLFTRFYRVDKARSRRTEGAGLGLAICKAYVEAHGGTIRVASTPGTGTIFTVELPVRADDRKINEK